MSCCAVGCKNRHGQSKDIHFYRIPSTKTPFNAERRSLWLQAINRTDWSDDTIRNARICSVHFISGKVSMDPANPDFVPSLFPQPIQNQFIEVPLTMDMFYRRKNGVLVLRKSSLAEMANSLKATGVLSTVGSKPNYTQTLPEEFLPSLQQYSMDVGQISTLEQTGIQGHPQIKEEPMDQYISPDMEADTSNNAVTLPSPEPTTSCELMPSSTDAAGNVNEGTSDEWNENDGSSSPDQSHSIEVYVDLEQPPREEKSCRFCGKRFKKDSFLIRHVDKTHKGQKAFKCMKCNKEFEQRYQLVLHVRVHTGEKPFSCDFCGKTFSQNSGRIVHMRVHTGEKPYFCKKCGNSFPSGKHFKYCKGRNDSAKTTPEQGNTEENNNGEKTFKCSECNKEFKRRPNLALHMRVHTGEKPFSCDICGKTFTQSSSRLVHMRRHTGEKPYLCKKCGKRFVSSYHATYCTGRSKNAKKSFRCATCGRSFYTDSDLKVHQEVHESWKRHVSEKLQEQEEETGQGNRT